MSASHDSSFLKPLSVNDLLFLNAYLANGRHGTEAYRQVYPRATYNAAKVSAHRKLAQANIKAEIAQRVRAEAGITKEMVESTLLHALALANAQQDAAVIASIGMDCAKLAGFLVEKRADVTERPTQDRAVLLAELRQRGLMPSN